MKLYVLDDHATKADFFALEAELSNDFAEKVSSAAVYHPVYGAGVLTVRPGKTFVENIFEVEFQSGEIKRFSAAVFSISRPLTFVDEQLFDLWKSCNALHLALTKQWSALEDKARAEAKLAAKKAEQLKKAEEAYQHQKEKAIKDFNELVDKPRKKVSYQDEFYWSLGWLAKHIGTLKAAMPDYLETAFVNHFGDEALHSVTDSTKRTSNGFPMQWALSFTASLPRVSDVPATLSKYLSSTGKAIANTSFLWDLVDNYGFKFSKKQDVVDIMRQVPIEYIPAFNEGYKA